MVNDLHTNSTVGLCPPAINLDDGGTYRAGKAQLWIWEKWLDFWQQVKTLKKKKPLWLVLNGDLVDGDHHQTTQIISRNLADQHKIALKALEPALALKPEHLFVVRGTESHCGQASQWEELLAKDLKAEPEKEGVYSWYHLVLDCEKVRVDLAHHGKMGCQPWTQSNPTNALATAILVRAAERGEPPPHLVIRADKHRPADSGDHCRVRVIQVPSWQLSTAFGHRVGAGELLPVGGLVVQCDGGSYTVHKHYYNPPGVEPWRPA